MSQGSEKSPASSISERTPSPIRETCDDENVDQLAPSSPVQPDSPRSQSTQGLAAPVGAMQVPAGMQLPAGFPPMMMMAAPDPNDPNAPPHPMLIPGGYTPMFYPYPGVFSPKSKRRQVKNACTNCQKACKKCDDQRPCPRCVKYGVADDCADSVRKERKKGIKRGSYKKKQEGENEVQMQAFAIPPGYPWFPGFAQAGKDGQPQAYPYPYFITPMPAHPVSATSENGGSSSNTNGTPAAVAAAAAAATATAFPYQMYYGGGYPYMPGWPADPAQAAAAMAAMQQLAGMAAGASSQTKENEVEMEEEDEKESEDEDGEGEIEESPVRRKPPTPPPPKPKEPAKKTKGKETAKRKSRAK